MSDKKNLKSILTTAMENATTADSATEPETQTLGEKMIEDLDKKAARKRLIKRSAIALAAGCALAYLAGRLTANSDGDEDATETSSED